MARNVRLSAAVFLCSVALLLALGGSAFADSHGPQDKAPEPVVQVSMTVQRDLCVGYTTMWLSYDEGKSWHPFVQAPIHGDQINCPDGVVQPPGYSQLSLSFTPSAADGDPVTLPADDPVEPDPVIETQVVTLSQASASDSTSRARLESTTGAYLGGLESYWTGVNWGAGWHGRHGERVEFYFGTTSD